MSSKPVTKPGSRKPQKQRKQKKPQNKAKSNPRPRQRTARPRIPAEAEMFNVMTPGALAARQRIRSEGASMSPAGKAAFIQATLPYDAPLTRVRPHGAGTSLQSTALARNFLTVELPLAEIMAIPMTYVPLVSTYSVVSDPVPLWGTTTSSIPVVQYHDALVYGIIPVPNAARSPMIYLSVGNFSEQSDDGVRNTTCPASAAFVCEVGNWGNNIAATCIAPAYFRPTTAAAQYGQKHLCFTRLTGGALLRYFWVDAATVAPATLSISLSLDAPANIAAAALLARVVRLNADEVVEQARLDFPVTAAGASVTVSTTLILSGFYAVMLYGSIAGATALGQVLTYSPTVSFNAATSLATRFLLNDNLYDARHGVERVQVNGSACLIRNTQSLLGRGQTVYALSVGERDVLFNEYTSNTARITSSNSLSRYEGPWEHGIYGFCKPSNAFYPEDLFKSRPTGDFENLNDLTRPDGMNVYLVAAAASTDYAPRAQLIFCAAYEFTTQSQMFVKGMSSLKQDDFGRLVDTLQLQHPFTENPLHWSTFLDAIRGGAKKVLEWAPKIVNGVTTAGNVASKLAGILAAV